MSIMAAFLPNPTCPFFLVGKLFDLCGFYLIYRPFYRKLLKCHWLSNFVEVRENFDNVLQITYIWSSGTAKGRGNIMH
jgi:hypothetical protein